MEEDTTGQGDDNSDDSLSMTDKEEGNNNDKDEGTMIVTELTGEGGDNYQREPDTTDTRQLTQTDSTKLMTDTDSDAQTLKEMVNNMDVCASGTNLLNQSGPQSTPP